MLNNTEYFCFSMITYENNIEKFPQRLAVLIDAENAQAAVIKSILADIITDCP